MSRGLLKTVIAASLLSASVFVAPSGAFAENRLALVIGQSAYKTAPTLLNTANDAAAMTTLLGKAGFEVTTATDLTQLDMRSAVADFAAKIAAKGADTVVAVFYAGHGLQVDGLNFLVPVDVNLTREADVPLQAVRLDDVMNALSSAPTKMRLVMLDACRNNPFTEINKTTGRGLAIVDAQAGTSGTFISYSTSPGGVAEDGTGQDSPYTTALLLAAAEPNVPIEETFKRVRVSVNQSTEGRQLPWESSSLVSGFSFFGQGAKAAHGDDQRSAEGWRSVFRGKSEQEAYTLVIQADSVAGYEAFVAIYAQSPHGNQVRSILDRRREMEAWFAALDANTSESFRLFLEKFPSSDLAATARKLQERQRNRALSANAALTGPVPQAAPSQGNSNRVGGAGSVTRISAPTCPCTAPEPAVRRVSVPPAIVVSVPPPVVVRRDPPRPPPRGVVIVEGRPPRGPVVRPSYPGRPIMINRRQFERW